MSLLGPFFPEGWAALPKTLDEAGGTYLTNAAAMALESVDELRESAAAYGAALASSLGRTNWAGIGIMSNLSRTLRAQNRLAQEERCILLKLTLATLRDDREEIFHARQYRLRQLAQIGRWADAQNMWNLFDSMGRDWSRVTYRPGDAEYQHAQFRFWQGDLSEEHLVLAEELSKAGKNRDIVRRLHRLRGEWRLEHGEWAVAAESLREAVSMARAVGQTDATAEIQLALARFRLGQLADPRREIEQLANAKRPAHRALAELWLAIGHREQATHHALGAYKWAWADGEPYVHRYELNKTRDLLEKLGAEIPTLPPYDPAKDQKFPGEDDIAAAIEKLQAEKNTSTQQH